MNRLLPRVNCRESGAAAVEFAVLLITVLIPLLAGGLYFGRFYWHYTDAEKAAQDAARFIAVASPTELKTQCTVFVYKDPCIAMAAMFADSNVLMNIQITATARSHYVGN